MTNQERQATEELMRLLASDARSPAKEMLHMHSDVGRMNNLYDLFDLVTRAGFALPEMAADGAMPMHTSWIENGVRREGVGG